jgi:hypothetical protein
MRAASGVRRVDQRLAWERAIGHGATSSETLGLVGKRDVKEV